MTWWPFAAACATHSLNRFLSPELGSSDVRVQSYGPGAQNFLHTEQGTITGRDQIAAYLAELGTAFPDAAWEVQYKHETGDTAIDEGYFVGTNTGSMTGPNGETIPATGRRVRSHQCDVATVENGVVTSHRFYFDVRDWLTQLGLAPESRA